MQPGYGGVSEIPQFMIETSLFNPSSAAASTQPTDVSTQHELKYHQLPHPHHPNLHHGISQPPPLMPHMPHFHSIPITQQLFSQSQHQFQLFHHHHHQQHHHPAAHMENRRLVLPHQLGLDHDSGPENSGGGVAGGGGGGAQHSFLAAPMSFKLAMNDSSGGGSRDMNEDDGDDGSESRVHHWQREDESAIKEPSWRPLDIDYINRNNKRCKDKELETPTSNYCKKSKEVTTSEHVHAAEAGSGAGGSNSYKVFSELEAIYKPGNGGSAVGGAIGPNQNQTGSGSALTGDETPILHAATPTAAIPELQTNEHLVGGSTETSAGEEAPVKKLSKGSCKRKRKRRRQQQQLSSIAAFFESLVKQLIEHQEALHNKFLEVMEKRDQERAKREEAWRKQESAKSSREAAARAQERVLAASREDAIISFLEKITGESLNLPPKPQFSSYFADLEAQDDENGSNKNNDSFQIELLAQEALNSHEGLEMNKMVLNTSRWPKAEVQALIRVRSGLEPRFQEPGLKGPLWEEVSTIMAAMGYQRSAKRCKEKWENINKYFRKTKESGKKRPEQSKTCPYFQQLDQLYSKSVLNNRPLPSSDGANAGHEKRNSELLDAILGKGSNEASGSGTASGQGELGHRGHGDNGNEDNEDDEDEEQGREGEEGEGESQDHHEQQQYHQQQEDDLHESALFFQRLQS